MKSLIFMSIGIIAWYMAWRAQAKRKAFVVQAERLLEMGKSAKNAGGVALHENGRAYSYDTRVRRGF